MATQNITGSLGLNAAFTEVIPTSTGLLNQLNLPASVSIQQAFSNNTTGALTVDQIHAKVYTLAASATTIDLTSLADLGGNSMNFARVRVFLAYNQDTVASHIVTVYRGASNGWSYLPASTGPLTVPSSGGVVMLFDPNSATGTNGMVVSGTSKTITLDPGSNTVNLSVLIVGGSAS